MTELEAHYRHSVEHCGEALSRLGLLTIRAYFCTVSRQLFPDNPPTPPTPPNTHRHTLPHLQHISITPLSPHPTSIYKFHILKSHILESLSLSNICLGVDSYMRVVQNPSSAPSMVALCGADGGGDNEDIDDDDDD